MIHTENYLASWPFQPILLTNYTNLVLHNKLWTVGSIFAWQ